jgi:hypothetical protein
MPKLVYNTKQQTLQIKLMLFSETISITEIHLTLRSYTCEQQ